MINYVKLGGTIMKSVFLSVTVLLLSLTLHARDWDKACQDVTREAFQLGAPDSTNPDRTPEKTFIGKYKRDYVPYSGAPVEHQEGVCVLKVQERYDKQANLYGLQFLIRAYKGYVINPDFKFYAFSQVLSAHGTNVMSDVSVRNCSFKRGKLSLVVKEDEKMGWHKHYTNKIEADVAADGTLNQLSLSQSSWGLFGGGGDEESSCDSLVPQK